MAAEQITQDITLPDEPPSSRDRVNFRPRADTFVAWMKTFATQTASLIPKINTALTWINTSVENVLTYSQTATTQAGIATTKAGEASASAASALSSKEAAEAIFDSFDDKYLGAKSTEPTVDNDGNPLVTGALFFKTTSPKGIYVYDAELSVWSIFSYVPTSHGTLSGRSDVDSHPMNAITGLIEALSGKQALLVSGTNIKTINNTSPLGSGNIDVSTPDATDTVKGKVELATKEEVQAGTDTLRAVTPAGLLSAFANSKSTSGYIKLPSGVIIQWGKTPVLAYGNSSVTFPITFTTTSSVMLMPIYAGYITFSSISTLNSASNFTSSFLFQSINSSNTSYAWIAIGY